MDHEATRRGMQQHVGKRVCLRGDHPQSGKQGRADRVEDVNGAPALIIKLDNWTETPVTFAPHCLFLFESHEEEARARARQGSEWPQGGSERSEDGTHAEPDGVIAGTPK